MKKIKQKPNAFLTANELFSHLLQLNLIYFNLNAINLHKIM